MKFQTPLTYVLLGILSLGFPALAQSNVGEMRVWVGTKEMRPVANAIVTVKPRNGQSVAAQTDEEGIANFPNLATGFYEVTAAKDRYIGAKEPSVRLTRNKTLPLELVLKRDDRSAAIEEMVVVADQVRGDFFGSVSNTYVDREQLRTAAGSGSDVLRALDGLPGLVSTGDFASFTVRGRGPQDNLIFVDGFPYDQVTHFESTLGEQEDIDGGGRYSIFAPNLIQGAEYSPGGWSAAYGGRNGSLLKLNVIEGNPSPSANLRLDLAGFEANYDGPSGFHDDTSLVLSARRLDFGQLFDLIDEKDNGEPVLTDIILKTNTRINDNNELSFLLLHTPETFERNVEHVLEQEELEDFELIDTERDSTLLGVTWTRLFGEDGRWENRFFYRDTERTSREGESFFNTTPSFIDESLVPTIEDVLTIKESEQEIGWRSDLSVSNGLGVFAAGVQVSNLDLELSTNLTQDLVRYEYDSSDFRADANQRFVVLTPEDTNSSFDRSETLYSGYVEQTINRGPWDIRAGVRYEQDDFADDSYVSPRLSINYNLSPRSRISATAGTFYQSPRFLDRAADPANVELASEKVTHYSVGYERQLGENWNVLAEVYYQDLEDLVVDGDPVTGLTSNDGEGTAQGIDLVLNRYFSDGWTANFVYSFSDVELDDNDGDREYPSDYNYEHLFSVGATWEINERWQLAARWKYATGRPRDEYLIHTDVLSGVGGPLRFSRESISNNTERWDDFHTLNVRVDYRRPLGPVDMVAFLDVLNIYGSSSTDVEEFNYTTGEMVEDDGDVTPLFGFRFEKTW